MVLTRFKIGLILLIALLFLFDADLFGADAGKILKTLEKEFRVKKSELTLEHLSVNGSLKACVDDVFLVKLNDEATGYVIDATGKGRHDEFEFLIFINLKKDVEFVRIVNYISDHGGEIASRRWLDQFIGYSGRDLKYGEDIQAISGATISANSVVSRIKEIIGQLKAADL